MDPRSDSVAHLLFIILTPADTVQLVLAVGHTVNRTGKTSKEAEI